MYGALILICIVTFFLIAMYCQWIVSIWSHWDTRKQPYNDNTAGSMSLYSPFKLPCIVTFLIDPCVLLVYGHFFPKVTIWILGGLAVLAAQGFGFFSRLASVRNFDISSIHQRSSLAQFIEKAPRASTLPKWHRLLLLPFERFPRSRRSWQSRQQSK